MTGPRKKLMVEYIQKKKRKGTKRTRRKVAQSFLLLLPGRAEDEPWRSGEGDRLRSHSAMRVDAVR